MPYPPLGQDLGLPPFDDTAATPPALPSYAVPPAPEPFDEQAFLDAMGAPPLPGELRDPFAPEEASQAPPPGRYFGSPTLAPEPSVAEPAPTAPEPTSAVPAPAPTAPARPQSFAEMIGAQPVPAAPEPAAAPPPVHENLFSAAIADQGEYERQLGLPEEQRIRENADRELRRQQMYADAEEAARRDRDLRQAEIEHDRLAAREAGRAEAKSIQDAATALASERGFSGAQGIAGVIAGMISGLLNPGGPNAGVQLLQGIAERNIAQRREALRTRMDLLADRRQAAEEDYRIEAEETVAVYERAKQEALSEAQKYDPRGTRFAQIVDMTKQYEAAQQAALEKAAQLGFENELKSREDARASIKTDLEVRRYNDEARRRAAAAASAGARARQETLKRMEERFYKGDENIDYGAFPSFDKWLKAGAPMRNKPGQTPGATKTPEELAYDKAHAVKEQAEASLKQREATAGPGGSPYAVGDARGQPYRNKDGTTFEVRDDFRRQRISQLNVAAQNMRRIADLVSILRDKGGGASSILGSDEYQELKTLAAQLDFETYKAFGLGAPSSGDREMAEAARGGKDITSFIYNPEVGFQAYASGVEKKLNSEMRDAGFTGADVKIPRHNVARALERSKEDLGKAIASPIPPHATDPETRQRYVQEAVENTSVLLKRKKPTAAELHGWALDIDKQVQAGKMTKAEAVQIVAPMASTIAKDFKRQVEDMSIDELKKLQKDPAFMNRVLLGLGQLHGTASPDEIYELVVGE